MTYSTADNLEVLACHCEIEAGNRDLDEWQRLNLTRQAETYRAQAAVERDARQSEPYLLANVLLERPLVETVALWILGGAIACIIAVCIYGAYYAN